MNLPSQRVRDTLIADHQISHLQHVCFHEALDNMCSYTRTYAIIRESVREETELQLTKPRYLGRLIVAADRIHRQH
jgi:hypothetical protein